MKQTYTLLIVVLLLCTSHFALAQGNVGIATTTPAEKLDVNGAIIIRTDAASSPPVAGTIRWNSTDGMHDGYTSAGSWTRLENDYDYLSGSYSTIGCGAALSTSIGTYIAVTTGGEDPFGTLYSDKRIQYLVKATELTAAGFCSGNITKIGFIVVSLGTTTINNFTIKLLNTASTSLTTTFATGAVSAYGPSTITVASGNNDFTLGTPYSWDGTSNLLIELCYDNASGGVNSSVQVQTGLAFNGSNYKTSGSSGCSFVSPAAAASAVRPVIRISGQTTGAILIADNYFYFSKGIVVGSPVLPIPYVSHGPGSVTAEGVYDDNVLLSDYVFDNYFDGKMVEKDIALHTDYIMTSLDDMYGYIKQYRHLPTIDGRDVWEQNGKFSVGKLESQLWATAETQSIYISQINDRITAVNHNLQALITK